MKEFSAIAFVPARKNSKRLPGKNKRLLNGKPLFQYTVEAAVSSKCYEIVILTTDDEEIIELGKRIEGLTILERPKHLAEDNIRARDVVLYHLKEIKQKFDYISLLMPTSPFRDAKDIKKSFELLIEKNGDSIASIVEYEFHPALALKIKKGRLYPYLDTEADFNWVRESEFEKAYHLNGAILTAKMDFLIETKSFIHNGTIPYLMSPLKSLDIDTETDFKYAEFIVKEKLI